ncbi:MAG: MFS transporter [Chloroflexota bacterium]
MTDPSPPSQTASFDPNQLHSGETRNLNTTRLLIGLMVPMGMTVLNLSMFGVALPQIRDAFVAPADLVAWLVTAYTLPFMMFMPFYGRMADGLGKRRLFIIGIIIFFVGTTLCMVAPTIQVMMVGRVIQGVGTAGVNPLCIAIITDLFPLAERGKAMGTWSSTGPATSMIGPLLAGFLIDTWNWRAIFVPDLLASVIALYVVYVQFPVMRAPLRKGFLRSFDWVGMVLLGLAITLIMFFFSSRPITGWEPLTDWRLLLGATSWTIAFVLWEQRYSAPLVSFGIFRRANFGIASLCAGLRMFMMSGIGFLIPLYLADIHNLGAAGLGVLLTLHSGALLITVRQASGFADRIGSRAIVVTGLGMQGLTMVYFAFLPASASIVFVGAGLVVHGMVAGLSLAVLHRASMSHIGQEESGAAAGLYSMVRFSGNIVGATLGGVVLQQALSQATHAVAYPRVFLLTAAMGFLGAIAAFRLGND